MEGAVLGHYRLGPALGSGGMGTVHAAVVTGEVPGVPLGARVALKILHPHLAARPDFVRRFLREARAGMAVRHENVVAALDAGEGILAGRPARYLAMEYVEGQTLRDLFGDLGLVPEALLREIARQVAAGLESIHAAGLVHRDLKPENLLITRDDTVRIMDFGLARAVDGSELTQAGQFAGTLAYASPEQFGAGALGPASDLYSLGVVLHELAAGRNPFARAEPMQAMAAHLTEEAPPLARENPEVSAFLSALVAAMLVKDPARRLSSARLLKETLERGEESEWWAAAEADALSPLDARPRVPVRRETSLLGRTEDLHRLRQAFTDAKAGEGGIALLLGESGIGKSRLFAEFADSLEGGEASILYAACPASGGLRGFTDALLARFGEGGVAAALHRLLPSSPAMAEGLAAAARGEAGGTTLPLDALQAVSGRLLRALAAERPVLWAIDDFHLAGPDVRSVAVALARAAADCRALIVLAGETAPLEEAATALAREPRLIRLPLDRLGAAEVIDLLSEVSRSEAVAQRLGARLAEKSDGVPGFVFEILRSLRESGVLEEGPDGAWVERSAVTEIETPSALRDLVAARLSALTREEREVLDVASVEGFEFDADLAARVLARRRFAVLQDLSEIERRTGLVRSAGRKHRFDHHQAQDVLYSALSPPFREECHALLAEAMAEREGTENTEPATVARETAAFLARHGLLGARPAEALPFLLPAIDWLEGSYRGEAALGLMDRALSTPGLLPGRLRCEVLMRRAARMDFLGRRDDQRRALEEALALADGPAQRASVLHGLGWQLLSVSRPAEARETLAGALECARQAADRHMEAAAQSGLGSACRALGDFAGAGVRFGESLAISRASGDRLGEAVATGNLGLVLRAQGRYEEAQAMLAASRDAAREAGDRRKEAAVTVNLGVALRALGRLEEARRAQAQALAAAREVGYRAIEAAALGNLAILAQDLGTFGEARDRHHDYLSLARELGNRGMEAGALANLGEVWGLLGDAARSREHYAACRALAAQIGDRRVESYGILGLGTAAELEGAVAEAEARYREALALRRALGYEAGTGDSLLALGALLAGSGRGGEAAEMLSEALRIGTKTRSPRLCALAAAHLAGLPGGDQGAAAAAIDAHAAGLSPADRLLAEHLAYRATGDEAHLSAARGLLTRLVAEAPAECRESMVAGHPLYRAVSAPPSSSPGGGGGAA